MGRRDGYHFMAPRQEMGCGVRVAYIPRASQPNRLVAGDAVLCAELLLLVHAAVDEGDAQRDSQRLDAS